VHLTIDGRIETGELSEATLRVRIQRIGQTEFDEIRSVLWQENFVLPPPDNGTLYSEFAAVFLELLYFGGMLLPRYFPSLEHDLPRIEGILAEDVDAFGLLQATRLAGSPEPGLLAGAVETAAPVGAVGTPARPPGSATQARWLVRRAARARARGNIVRAAWCAVRARPLADPDEATALRH